MKSDHAIHFIITSMVGLMTFAAIWWSGATIGYYLFALANETYAHKAFGQEQKNNSELSPTSILVSYTLNKINEDRAKYNLMPLNLSENKAAQIHADNLFEAKDQYPSHWTTDGMKPYMIYSKYNGSDYVEQNVAVSGYNSFETQQCKDNDVLICETINPFKQIDDFEWNMISNDTSCCENKHRANILGKYHTDVSIGIAYDNYYFVLVQNFENNYIKLEKPLTQDNREIQISGRVSTDNYELDSIGIFYDKTPDASFYKQNRDNGSYSLGKLTALVVKPPPLFSDYKPPSSYTLIEANKWTQDGSSLDIVFDLSPIIKTAGVYTIVVYLKDKEDVRFPVMLYSIFV
jgi:cysteine-rich secretory family protein